jgi:RNA polymerase sigma factor (sigma-70 family)
MNPTELSDASLIKQFQNGDQNSLGHLFRRHKLSLIMTLVNYMGNDFFLINDLIQETFAKVTVKLRSFSYEDINFAAWLKRIAINLSVDHHRRRKRDKIVFVEPEKYSGVSHTLFNDYPCTPEELLLQKEVVQILIRCIEKLPAKQKEIVIFRYCGIKFDDIAFYQKVSKNTALRTNGICTKSNVQNVATTSNGRENSETVSTTYSCIGENTSSQKPILSMGFFYVRIFSCQKF